MTGAHAWCLTDGTSVTWKSGQKSPGHQSKLSAKRTELSGQTSVLFLLDSICTSENIKYGSTQVLCDCKGAISQMLHSKADNPLDNIRHNHDLIQCA